jgi:hypothetical protein
VNGSTGADGVQVANLQLSQGARRLRTERRLPGKRWFTPVPAERRLPGPVASVLFSENRHGGHERYQPIARPAEIQEGR